MSLRLPILSIVLLAGAGVGAAWLMRSRSVDSRQTLDSSETAVPLAAPADALELVRTKNPEAEDIEDGTDREQREVATRNEPIVELGEALWVEGRVILPEGTPAGERVEVVAKGIRTASQSDHRSLVGAGGSFRVAFAPGTEKGTLELRSPYLYLESRVEIEPSKPPEDLVLLPKLGGCIRGRLVLSRESPEARRSLADGRIRISKSGRPGEGAPHHVSAKLSAALEFDCPGVPPGDHYTVSLRSRGEWCSTTLEEVSVVAGQITRADLSAFPGVRIAGQVVDEFGAPVARAKVEAWRLRKGADKSEGARAFDSNRPIRAVRSYSDGKFVLAGVDPGELLLVASDQRTTPAYVEIGNMNPDATVKDVTVVLRAELSISGIVRWPDGALAACELLYESRGEMPIGVPEWKRRGSLDLEDGRFAFPVAGPGPWALTARARRAEGHAGDRDGTSATWVAHEKKVMAGTIGIVMTLAPTLSIRGRVLDESGAPLPFPPRLRASPLSESNSSFLDTVDGEESQADGTFDLGGLHEGTWRIHASARNYVQTAPTIVEVRGEGSTVEITMTRTGTLSGRVVDPRGQPVPGAKISFSVGGITTWGNPSDAEGRFSIRDVVPGSLVLLAEVERRGTSRPMELLLSPGQHLENLEFVLLPSEVSQGK